MESLQAYIPIDRRIAMAQGKLLPERTNGAALFADISGFMRLTDALVQALGPQRGAEELPHQLNRVYDAIIAEVEGYGGSVVGFSGDAITCWLDGDDGRRAVACGLAIQQAMQQFASVPTPDGATVTLAIKVAVATGVVRRFVVGDPEIQLIDVLAGATLDRLARVEQQAHKGEVALDRMTALALGDLLDVAEWRIETREPVAVVRALRETIPRTPWPPVSDELSVEQTAPWLLPPVYERLKQGSGEFLTEIRPAVALFLRFSGIDYDHDVEAAGKLDAYIRWVQHVLTRFGGYLIQLTLGDKGSYLYAAFGAPLAFGENARRAAAAALELRVPPADLMVAPTIQIGISRGRMRTGAYGARNARTYGVLGPEVNVAARLMQNADPGSAIVSEAAHSRIVDLFAWLALPPLQVKGRGEPIRAFRLIGTNAGRSTNLTVHLQEPRYGLPMVGRQAELRVIADKLEQAKMGRGQVVSITADAGMGKSRLVAESIRLVPTPEWTIYAGECQAYGTTNSYLAWEPILRDFFGLASDASRDDQIQMLEAQLSAIDPSLIARLPLLGIPLNLSIPDNDVTQSLDVKLRKASLEALLVDCLRARAKTTPIFILLEDCHWLDPLSHDLLEAIARSIADLPVMLLVAYRPPELERLQAPRITALTHSTVLALTEFSAEEAGALIKLKLQQVGSGGEASASLVGQITARAQGNPFYIEELLNYLRDRGINPCDVRAVAQLDLPNSLHSLILGRIDQLSEREKITVKVASVIGRLFHFTWLCNIHPEGGEQERVHHDLDRLSRLDLTPLDQPEPELTYLFKHVVTREAAYGSLPFATRAVLHDRLAQFIERTYRESLEQYLDLLAYHYDHSQNLAKKREYLGKAAAAAEVAYNNQAAIDYYRRLLPLLSESDQVEILLRLGQVLEVVGQWREAADMYDRALEGATELRDRQVQARVQCAIGDLFRKRGEYSRAKDALAQARAAFEEIGDRAGVGQALHYAGTIAAQQGDSATARLLYEESLAIRRDLDDKRAIASLLSNLAIIARWQQDYPAARALNEESLQIRRALGDRWAIGVSLNNLALLCMDESDFTTAQSLLEEAVQLQREVGDRSYLANSLTSLADFELDRKNYAAARNLLKESLAINRELGDRRAIAFLLENFAVVAAAGAMADRALRLAAAAEALRETINAPLSQPEQAKLERRLERARQERGEGRSAAWEAGKKMTMDAAVAMALEDDT